MQQSVAVIDNQDVGAGIHLRSRQLPCWLLLATTKERLQFSDTR